MKQEQKVTSYRYPRHIFVPPMWLTLIITCAGIYGMNLVYRSITDGGLVEGIVGGILLGLCVYAIGTPLALAYLLKRQAKRVTKAGISSRA